MRLVAAFLIVVFSLLLIAFTVVAFARPALAEQFLMRFASSTRTHYVEQLFRLLVGASLVVFSSAMRQPKMFWLVGWAIVASSAVLVCMPWQWHHRFGERVLPIVVQHLK